MATRFAIATGNWSNPAIWDDGIGPVAGDVVFANSYTVTINQNITAGSINTTQTSVFVVNIATPIMTSNTAPSGIASSSSQLGANSPFRAFDQSSSTSWAANNLVSGWLKYQFPSAKIIKRYAILGSGTQTANPRVWTFEGSNDDVNWTVLQTVSQASPIPAGTWYNSGILANTTAYLYYRINNTLTGGSSLVIPAFDMTESTSTSVGGNSGGGFTMSTAYNISANINSGTTTCLVMSHTTGTVNITGNILGSATTTNTYGANNTSSGGVSIIGNIAPGNISSSTTHGFGNQSTGTITVVGNITNGNSGTIGLLNNSTGALNLTGTFLPVAGGAAIRNASTGSITVNAGSVIQGGFGSNGLYNEGGVLNITATINGGGGGSAGPGLYNNSNSNPFTIVGNINGGGSGTTGHHGFFNNGAASGTITGNINAGLNGSGVFNNGLGTINITGTATGNIGNYAIFQNGAGTVILNGNAVSGTNGGGMYSLNTGATNVLNGNAINFNGANAIACVKFWLTTGLSSYRFQQYLVPSTDIILYPPGVPLGNPPTADVRSGVTYASGALTGTLVVPAANTVTLGVTYDNGTVGTAQNTAASFLAELGVSTDPLAVRLQNVSTVQTTGAQIAAYNV